MTACARPSPNTPHTSSTTTEIRPARRAWGDQARRTVSQTSRRATACTGSRGAPARRCDARGALLDELFPRRRHRVRLDPRRAAKQCDAPATNAWRCLAQSCGRNPDLAAYGTPRRATPRHAVVHTAKLRRSDLGARHHRLWAADRHAPALPPGRQPDVERRRRAAPLIECPTAALAWESLTRWSMVLGIGADRGDSVRADLRAEEKA